MRKFTKNFYTRSTFVATSVGKIERFVKLVRNSVCMRVPTSQHPGTGVLARTVKLKQGVILNLSITISSAELFLLKILFTG